MRKTFLILFFLLYSFSFAQTSGDTIKGSINVKFLNSLVLDLCNQKTSDSSVFKKSNPITFKCAEYQSSYMSKYSICTHDNDKIHKGVLLEDIVDRRDNFNLNQELRGSMGEVCTFAVFEYGKTTYEELAIHIMNNFFGSTPHRKTIFISYPYGNFSCTEGTWKGQKGVYVTGFFSR
jgi:hypothetical protein